MRRFFILIALAVCQPQVAAADLQSCREALETMSVGKVGIGMTVCADVFYGDDQSYNNCDKLYYHDIPKLANAALVFSKALDDAFMDNADPFWSEHLRTEDGNGVCTFLGEFSRKEIIYKDPTGAVAILTNDRCSYFGVSVDSDFYANYIEIPGEHVENWDAFNALHYSCPPDPMVWYSRAPVINYQQKWKVVDSKAFSAWPDSPRIESPARGISEDRLMRFFPDSTIIARSSWTGSFSVQIDSE